MANSEVTFHSRLATDLKRRFCNLIDSRSGATALFGIQQSCLTSMMHGHWRASALAHINHLTETTTVETVIAPVVESTVASIVETVVAPIVETLVPMVELTVAELSPEVPNLAVA
jgi:hypothetical protein